MVCAPWYQTRYWTSCVSKTEGAKTGGAYKILTKKPPEKEVPHESGRTKSSQQDQALGTRHALQNRKLLGKNVVGDSSSGFSESTDVEEKRS
jgi:hypothetical protein